MPFVTNFGRCCPARFRGRDTLDYTYTRLGGTNGSCSVGDGGPFPLLVLSHIGRAAVGIENSSFRAGAASSSFRCYRRCASAIGGADAVTLRKVIAHGAATTCEPRRTAVLSVERCHPRAASAASS